jgi:hypothetical protein
MVLLTIDGVGKEFGELICTSFLCAFQNPSQDLLVEVVLREIEMDQPRAADGEAGGQEPRERVVRQVQMLYMCGGMKS